jgi:hypothetical protein
MESTLPLIGSWVVVESGDGSQPESTRRTIWHVLDHQTCVYQQWTDYGWLISWFQYWPVEGGILQYSLSKFGRNLFKTPKYVPITFQSDHLVSKGHKLIRATNLPIPERYDLHPGRRPDVNGNQIPNDLRFPLQPLLPEPPRAKPSAH